MVADGLVARRGLEDGRKSGVCLTAKGRRLLRSLEPHWAVTFSAIDELEREIGHPLLRVLEDAASALERKGFAARLRTAAAGRGSEESVDVDRHEGR
jgi:DNA-binding PadR family transcriptional regulator